MSKTNQQKVPARQTRSKRVFRRFVKIAFYSVIIFILVLVIAAIVLRLMFPPDKLRDIAIEKIETLLQKDVSVGEIDFGIFSGLTLKDVSIKSRPNTDSIKIPLRSGHLDNLVIRYRLLSLIKRQLQVYEITIDNPVADLVFHPVIEDSTKVPATNIKPPTSSQTNSDLPISVDLDNLKISNASCNLLFLSDTSTVEASIQGVSLAITNLVIPRGGIDSLQQLAGNVNLQCRQAPALFRQETDKQLSPFKTQGILNLNLSGIINSFADVYAELNIAIEEGELALPSSINNPAKENSKSVLPTISVQINADGDILTGNYNVQKLMTGIGDDAILDISGTLENLSSSPGISASINNSEINLSNIRYVLTNILSDGQIDTLFPGDITGRLSLAGSKIEGKFPKDGSSGELNLTMQLDSDNITGSYSDILHIDSLSLHTTSRFNMVASDISESSVIAELGFKQLAISLNDTTTVLAKHGRINTETELMESFLPRQLDFNLFVNDIIGSKFETTIKLIKSTDQFEYQGNGNISLQDFPVNFFLPQIINGSVDANVNLNISSLNDIAIDFKTDVDSVTTVIADEEELLPNFTISGLVNSRTDTSLQNFWIDSLLVNLGDLFSSRGSGYVLNNNNTNSFKFSLLDASLTHNSILEYLPESIKLQLGSFSLNGETHLSGIVNGIIQGDSTVIQASGNLTSENVQFEYPQKNISISGMHIVSSFSYDNNLIDATLKTQIKNMTLQQFRMDPINNTELQVQCNIPAHNQILFKNCELNIPDFASNISFFGSISTLDSTKIIDINTSLSFNSADSIHVTEQLAVIGNANIAANLRMTDNKSSINGLATFNGIDLFMGGQAAVLGVKGEIPFAQSYNMRDQVLMVESKDKTIFSNTGSDYSELFGVYYSKSVRELGWLTVDQFSAATYNMQNIRISMFMGSGRVEIPSILINLYNGNFGGSASVDLSAGKLENASFELEGHLSSINSALLTQERGEKPEQGIINANFLFSGYGLDLKRSIDLEGYFYITDIGPRTADNLLSSLDPENTDSGIRNTRFLIKHGFKPKLMSFEIKHGYFYPKINLSQPWYFPARIKGGKVELNRIPIKLFLRAFTQSEGESN